MRMRRSTVRLLREAPFVPNYAGKLHDELILAADAARMFAHSAECSTKMQKIRWLSQADSLIAQANSLKSEVPGGEPR